MAKVDYEQMFLENGDLNEEKNIFLHLGGFWLIRYEGAEVKLIRSLRGLSYIQYYLQNPGKRRTVEEAEANVEGVTIPENDIKKLSDQDLYTGFRDTETDLRSLDEFHSTLNVLSKKITDHESGKITLSEEDIQRHSTEKKSVLEQLKKVINAIGRGRFEVNDVKRNRDRITAAIRLALKEIDSIYPPLGQHLRDHLENRIEGGYFPEDPLSWYTNSPSSFAR